MKILTINPGSTSTKIAVFESDRVLFFKNIRHSVDELKNFRLISDQYEFRKNIIHEELMKSGIKLDDIRIIVGRGGMLKPVKSGVYEINETMKKELLGSEIRQHASNLAALIADNIASELPSVKAYIADPVVVDELEEIARVSGHPLFKRISIFHALNHKSIARTHARSINKKYEELNLIVVHLGGGISVGAHHKGRVIDVNQAFDGEGPFAPERSGSLSPGDLVKLCFSGKYTKDDILKMITGEGGLNAWLGTTDAQVVQERIIKGDKKALKIFEAMAYQVSKEIGSAAVVLKGEVDYILLTGGLSYNNDFVKLIIDRINMIAPVAVYPGEDEMKALAMNGLMVLNGEVIPKVYK